MKDEEGGEASRGVKGREGGLGEEEERGRERRVGDEGRIELDWTGLNQTGLNQTGSAPLEIEDKLLRLDRSDPEAIAALVLTRLM